MFILQKYADDADLTWFEKLKFSAEDKLHNNPRVRAWYLRYFLLPEPLKFLIAIPVFLFALIPLVFIGLCLYGAGWLEEKTDWLIHYEWGLLVYVVGVAIVAFFQPLVGLLLVFMTFNFLLMFWLVLHVMDDYNHELRERYPRHGWNVV